MKACVLYGKLDLRYEDVAEPQLSNDEDVLVKILAGGICGSDQHYYLEGGIGTSIVVREPIVIGHEGCGIVEATGSKVEGLKPGDMVILRPARPCFKDDCYYCSHHMYTYCENMRHLGSAMTFPHVQGLFAEKVVVHKSQCFVAHDISPEVAAFAEPLGVAYNGVHKLGNVLGKDVAVMGAGPIGLLCVAAAKILGANKVVAIDVRDEPLKVALEMGADEVINSKTQGDKIQAYCAHRGQFDCGMEASGNGFACNQLMQMVRPEGVISQVGMFGNHVPTDLGPFASKGLHWNASFRFYDEFGAVVRALESGLINPLPLLSASFSADQCVKAMEAAVSPETCKVQVKFY